MNRFECPCCNRRSVVFDPRAGCFVCLNSECAITFAPPKADPGFRSSRTAVACNPIQGWFTVDRAVVPKSMSVAQANVKYGG
jgi:hypothetical protein